MTLLYIVLIVAIGLTFDFTNGFHDSANAVAAPIATKAITLILILLGAALFWVERKKIFAGWHAAESKGPDVREPALQPAG